MCSQFMYKDSAQRINGQTWGRKKNNGNASWTSENDGLMGWLNG